MPFFSIALRTLALLSSPLIIHASEPRGAQETSLSREETKHFLLTAEGVASKASKKGETQPTKLTLSNGTITHDASFQPVDIHKSEMKMASSTTVTWRGIERGKKDLYSQSFRDYALRT